MNTAIRKLHKPSPGSARSLLETRRRELADRIDSIERSRQRGEALSPNSAERQVESANDTVLDRLAETTRRELEQVRHVLERLDAGRYGQCERCGRAIDAARLRAVPETTRCHDCAGIRG